MKEVSMAEWQPMDSAPAELGADDPVLGTEEGRVFLMWWSSHYGWNDCSIPDHLDTRVNPTHWMRLPEPPAL